MNSKYFYQIFIILLVSLASFDVQNESADSEVSLLVHKTPTCGCCKMWIKHLEGNGLSTTIQDHTSLQEIKEKYDINQNIDPVILVFQKMVLSLKGIFQVNI